MTEHLSPRQRAQVLLQEGVEAGDNSTAAIALFRQSAAVDPSWALPPFLLGSYFAANSQFEAAEHELATATLLGPDFPLARYQLGTLQFSSGRPAAALVSWEPLIALEDTSPLPHFVRGYAALAQNDLTSALAYFQAGLSKSKDNAALSADIELVVARTAALQGQAATTQVSAPTWASDLPHVLFSNYQHPDSVH